MECIQQLDCDVFQDFRHSDRGDDEGKRDAAVRDVEVKPLDP